MNQSRSSRRVLFVAGKGGVGKTSVSCATALARARGGERVLLASTDPAHNLGHAWDADLGDRPTRVHAAGSGCVDAVEIDPAATVDRHLAAVGATMRRLLPERLHAAAERHLALAREAPGTHESAVLERIADLVTEGLAAYDAVVVDTAPTGHTLRLMALPEQLLGWTESLLANRDRAERFGAALRGLGGGSAEVDRDAELRRVLLRRRERFAQLHRVVTDTDLAAFVVVLTAERLPVAETLDLLTRLDELGIGVERAVVNRRSPAGATGLLAERRAVEDGHLAALRRAVPGLPVLEVPLLAGEPVGRDGLAVLAEHMSGRVCGPARLGTDVPSPPI